MRGLSIKLITIVLLGVLTAPTGCRHQPTSSVPDAKHIAHSVQLHWDPSPSLVSGHGEYRLYRGSPDCTNAALLVGGLFDTKYTDTNVKSKTTYCYQVTAVDNLNNESKRSSLTKFTIP